MVKEALHRREEREEGKRERLRRKWDGREKKERADREAANFKTLLVWGSGHTDSFCFTFHCSFASSLTLWSSVSTVRAETTCPGHHCILVYGWPRTRIRCTLDKQNSTRISFVSVACMCQFSSPPCPLRKNAPTPKTLFMTLHPNTCKPTLFTSRRAPLMPATGVDLVKNGSWHPRSYSSAPGRGATRNKDSTSSASFQLLKVKFPMVL